MELIALNPHDVLQFIAPDFLPLKLLLEFPPNSFFFGLVHWEEAHPLIPLGLHRSLDNRIR